MTRLPNKKDIANLKKAEKYLDKIIPGIGTNPIEKLPPLYRYLAKFLIFIVTYHTIFTAIVVVITTVLLVGGISAIYTTQFAEKPALEEEKDRFDEYEPTTGCPCGDCEQGIHDNSVNIGSGSNGGTGIVGANGKKIIDSTLNPYDLPLYDGTTMDPSKLPGESWTIDFNSSDILKKLSTGYNITHDNRVKVELGYAKGNYGEDSSCGTKVPITVVDGRMSMAIPWRYTYKAAATQTSKDPDSSAGKWTANDLSGRYFDVVFVDGTVLAGIMGDAKGSENNGYDGWAHHDGSLLEVVQYTDLPLNGHGKSDLKAYSFPAKMAKDNGLEVITYKGIPLGPNWNKVVGGKAISKIIVYGAQYYNSKQGAKAWFSELSKDTENKGKGSNQGGIGSPNSDGSTPNKIVTDIVNNNEANNEKVNENSVEKTEPAGQVGRTGQTGQNKYLSGYMWGDNPMEYFVLSSNGEKGSSDESLLIPGGDPVTNGGKDYQAYGIMQFDYRYDLIRFMQYAYQLDSTTWKGFEKFQSGYTNGASKLIGNKDIEKAFLDGYKLNPTKYVADQANFMIANYDLKDKCNSIGISLSDRHPALYSALLSCSINCGETTAFNNFKKAGANSSMTDESLIECVYDGWRMYRGTKTPSMLNDGNRLAKKGKGGEEDLALEWINGTFNPVTDDTTTMKYAKFSPGWRGSSSIKIATGKGGNNTNQVVDNKPTGGTGGIGGAINGGTKTNVNISFTAENVDKSNWDGKLTKEYNITSCDKLTVTKHLTGTLNKSHAAKYLNAFVVHYWGNESDGKLIVDPNAVNKVGLGDNMFGEFNSPFKKTTATFLIGPAGDVYQYVSLDRWPNTSNDNAGTLSIECSNYLAGGQFTEPEYKNLVHLTAWVCHTYNLSTEPVWENVPNSLKPYWDRGQLRRHYDNTSGKKFRGKTCPAYYTPFGVHSETKKYATEGGNLRWIAFKQDVTDFIIKYKDDPNFNITLNNGEELVGYSKSLDLIDRQAVPNWSNGSVVAGGNLTGEGCNCPIPCPRCHCHDNEVGTGNGSGAGNGAGNGVAGSTKEIKATDGAKISTGTKLNNGGEGKYWEIDDGVLSFKGTDWQSTSFLVKARRTMQRFVASGNGYVQATKPVSIPEVGITSTRMDCSGYVETALKVTGYPVVGLPSSQADLDKLYGFTRNDVYSNMKSGDIMRMINGKHTEIFVGWVAEPGGSYYKYNWGGASDEFAYGSYCEPRVSGSTASRFVCSYTPTELTTVTGVISTGLPDKKPPVSGLLQDSNMTGGPSEGPEFTSSTNSGFSISKIDDNIFKRISKSYNECTFRDDLRYLKVKYYNLNGSVKSGEIIVNKSISSDVLSIFEELYNNKYEFNSIMLIDPFYEDGTDGVVADNKSMFANNTSSFNYRKMTSSGNLSLHAKGLAIDINPQFNPYIKGDEFKPSNAGEYVDRSKDFEGKIDTNDLAYKLFTAKGFTWGGSWNSSKDYQHFERK